MPKYIVVLDEHRWLICTVLPRTDYNLEWVVMAEAKTKAMARSMVEALNTNDS